ncbi:MAG: type I glutamate--ammonia ligase [Legionellaceae bacterium]|nr:type I glutamate--ammonia ligase [Legionellaceae bacterium]
MGSNVVRDALEHHQAKFVDLRFSDLRGKEQHITIPKEGLDDTTIENGKAIDGSSFEGWQQIHQSDLTLVPDTSTIMLDPFYQEKTIFIRCNVVNPKTNEGYSRDPRSIATRAEAYLRSTGIADEAYFGPEPEFFLFDGVRWKTGMSGSLYEIESEEAQWNSGKAVEGGNIGHRPRIKGGYFPVPPVDSSQDIRSTISEVLQSLGMIVEAHHHEVATANQCEVATRYKKLLDKADDMQILKYVVHNVAHNYGKTATFMPKPLVGDNGSGMHCHQSLAKDGVNLFAGEGYGGLSEMALHYIGGIIHHARALNAITNATVNSYKRLLPGFEAPILLAYSERNRSASIRIPLVFSAQARRIEVRFPDSAANPYIAFSAMMMAGLDGIQRQLHPGDAMDKNLYDLPPKELDAIPRVAGSLEEAVSHLKNDYEFLLQGDVFTRDFIDAYIDLCETDIMYLRSMVHPAEFELYYSS